MDASGVSPGPISDRTFDDGFKLAAAGGLVAVVGLYWFGVLSITDGAHVVMTGVLFPVYLVFAGSLLGVWLGYDTDERDLRPVTDGGNEQPENGPGPPL